MFACSMVVVPQMYWSGPASASCAFNGKAKANAATRRNGDPAEL
jgi:hypothetical protein